MKHLTHFLLFGILVILICGCKKPTDASLANQFKKIELTPSTFDFVGEAHNDGLDYVFDNTLSKNPNSKFTDIKNASVKYVFDVNSYTKLSADDKSQFQTQQFDEFIKKTSAAKSIVLSENYIQSNLTEKQNNFVIKLNQELTNTDHTYDVIIGNIAALEKSAIKNLGEKEIVYALCVSSVAKHSVEYWNTSRGEKWFKHFNKSLISIGTFNRKDPPSKIDWHNVALADVLGFGAGFPSGVTVGMVAGGLTLGVPTGGAAAAIGAVLGGLVGGTATGLAGAVTASAATLGAEWVVSWFK